VSASARHRARELLVQALYQQQLAGHSAADLVSQFAEQAGFAQADGEYFQTLLHGILADTNMLDEIIAAHAARDLKQLDPVGRAILWLACYELIRCPGVPTRVVLDEAIELAKTYGATDSYRFVNALLDKARQSIPARSDR
jgi:N utilization substance protein B